MRSELRQAGKPTVTLTSPPTVYQTEGSKAGSQPSSPPLIHSSAKGSTDSHAVHAGADATLRAVRPDALPRALNEAGTCSGDDLDAESATSFPLDWHMR